MGLLDRFRKKAEKKQVEEVKKITTDFEEFCGKDKDVYEALHKIMFLEPLKIKVSMSEAEEKAKLFEKQKDDQGARMWYDIAGGIAIYHGDVEKVKKYFGKSARLSSESEYPVLKIPEKAVKVASEYYRKIFKEEDIRKIVAEEKG